MIREMQKKFEKHFMIVEFTNCLNDNGIADIDVDSNDWIYFDDEERKPARLHILNLIMKI